MTRGAAAALVAALLAGGAAAQTAVPEELLLLTRIKRHMQQALGTLPNYTCLETMERFRRESPAGGYSRLDTVRVEVAHIEGKELFAWPGDPGFREQNISSFVTSGTVADGLFSQHARSIFVDDQASFRYAGEEELDRHRAVRYDFRIGVLMSGYTISVGGRSANVATKGSFWADPETLDALRLEVHADEIPPDLPISDAIVRIDYAKMRVGGRAVLLPQSGELVLLHLSGAESRNLVEFTHCRGFESESTVRFGAAPEPPPAAPGGTPDRALPPGMNLRLKLATPIDSGRAAVGDSIQATLAAAVSSKGGVSLPEGARVMGRIRRLEWYPDPAPHFLVGLEFHTLEFGEGHVRFFAALREIPRGAGLEALISTTRSWRESYPAVGSGERSVTVNVTVPPLPGVGTFIVRGTRFELPKGLEMVWRTETISR